MPTDEQRMRERMVTAIAPAAYAEAMQDGRCNGWAPNWREDAAMDALKFADTLLAVLRAIPALEAKGDN